MTANNASSYDVRVNSMTGDGTVTVTIGVGAASDAAGNASNASTSSDNTVTYDTTSPSVTIDQASGQGDPTSISPIHFTAVFSEPVIGFGDVGDVTLSGTAGATIATVTQIAPNNGTTYNVAVSGMTNDGTVIATIPSGAATDVATNGSGSSTSTDNTVTWVQPQNNLVANPGFEDPSLAGWARYGDDVTLSRVQGGAHSGNWSMRVRSSDSDAFGCDDSPDWVKPVAAAGAVYRFEVWVKSTDNTKKIKLRVVEVKPSGSQQGSTVYSSERSLSTTWQLLTATFTAQQAGNSLSLRITESPSSSGKSFQVDDVKIEWVPTYTIVSSATAGGTISPLGSRTVQHGTNQTYAITPSLGWQTSDVLVDNTSVGAVPTHTFNDVSANHTIHAVFVQSPTGANLVQNGDFETTDLTRWARYGSNVTISHVTGGAHGGNGSMKVRSSSSSSFGCDDSPDWVRPVAGPGVLYKFTAWVKSTDNTKKISFRVSEVVNGSTVGQTVNSNQVTLSGNWQQLAAYFRTTRSNSSLSIRISESPSSSNKSFQVDDVSIVQVLGPAPQSVQSQETEGASAGLEFRALVAPNPARGAAVLRFATTQSGPLRVRLFDVSGRVVSVMMDEADAGPGERTLALHGTSQRRIQPGIYFYRIDAGEGSLAGRWVVLD